MKKVIYLLLFCILSIYSNAQTFSLTVSNGYGSGTYTVGDTVHIWAKEFPTNTIFDKWTGDIASVDMLKEWHTTLVMPPSNVNLTANFRTFSPFTISFDSIQGKVIKKPVYSYFPQNMYGVIYFFHGTGGRAIGWINSLENRQMVNQAISDSFGVIITEADEATTGVDVNADGKLRWNTFPVDSVNNVDFANIKIITDTFINRGFMTRNTKRFSLGMSNGGAYSASCSYLFNFNAGISYCAQGLVNVFATSTVPFQFCMAKYDANDNVGPTGNANALSNSNQLIARDICSRYYLHDHSPLYPERFMRISGVNLSKSQAVFNDFVNNGFLDVRNYISLLPDTIFARYIANPSLFPGFNALSGAQRVEIPNEVKVSYADHQFYSDYNSLSLAFLKHPCDSTELQPNSLENIVNKNSMAIFPNPATSEIYLDILSNDFSVEIVNTFGKLVIESKNERKLDVSNLSNGIYFVGVKQNDSYSIIKFVKQ